MALLARLARLALAAVVAALFAPAPSAAQDSLENGVKAAYLYNFTKFVVWPADKLGGRFTICVVGDPMFAASLDEIIKGEFSHDRPLVRLDPEEDPRPCQILYVGRSEAERGRRLLAASRQLPVLTVSDAPTFMDEGGAVTFVRDGTRLRFDINMPATDRAGLKVSSKLLRVARVVKGGPR